MQRIQDLFEREFDLLIGKQGHNGLEIADLRKLELLTRAWKSYVSNPIKKVEEDDFAIYTDEVLKRILNGSQTKPEVIGQRQDDDSGEVNPI